MDLHRKLIFFLPDSGLVMEGRDAKVDGKDS